MAAAALAYVSVEEARQIPCTGSAQGCMRQVTPIQPVIAIRTPTPTAATAHSSRCTESVRRTTTTTPAKQARITTVGMAETGNPPITARANAQPANPVQLNSTHPESDRDQG